MAIKDGRERVKPLPFILQPSVLSLVFLLLAACGATVTPPPPVFLRAAGSTTMGPLLTDLAAAYSVQRPYVTFDIQGGGSQLGHMLAEAGQVNIGLVSWPPQDMAQEWQVVPVARDAIAIILHPQNEASGLSITELRDMFSGRLLNWREVAGPARPIQVVSREDGSGTRAAFEAMVMEGQAVTPAAIVLPNSQAVVDFVAQTPNAIAYVSFNFIQQGVYAAPVEGIRPTLASLTGGSYLLTRDLAVIIPRRGQPQVEQLVDFILSPAGQAIVAEKWGRVR